MPIRSLSSCQLPTPTRAPTPSKHLNTSLARSPRSLEGDLELIRADLKNIKEIDMRKEDRDHHNTADTCWICGGDFKQYSNGDSECLWKVRDHGHFSGGISWYSTLQVQPATKDRRLPHTDTSLLSQPEKLRCPPSDAGNWTY